MDKAGHKGMSPEAILERALTLRNVVSEMIAELRCIKPMREPRLELQTRAAIDIQMV